MACQLGLDRIVLSKARMLPRDYLLLVEELTISSDVSLPNVVVTGKLGAGGLVGRTKAATMSGGTRGIRQMAGNEHEDAGSGFPERRRRRRTVDDAVRAIGTEGGWEDRTSWTCQTIGIPEGVAWIKGTEE